MQQLIRTRVATFTDKQMTTMQTFTDAMHFLTEGNEAEIKRVVLPVEAGVAHLKKVWIFDSVIGPMCTGAALAVPGISKLSADIVVGDMIALMSLKDELVSIATAKMNSADIHKNSRGIAATTLRVIMKDTVYPKGLAEIK
jgi:H/ACA ribonucleoprotein complex subunit 4